MQVLLRTARASAWLSPRCWSAQQRHAAAGGSSERSTSAVTDVDIAELNKEFRDFFGEASDGGSETTPTEGVEDASLLGRADALTDTKMNSVGQSRAVTVFGGEEGGESPKTTDRLTHVDVHGRATMVDVGNKVETVRVAAASGNVLLGERAFGMVKANQLKKGDVLSVAQLAGIMGAKATAQLIPLCHNIFLSSVDVKLSLDPTSHAVRIVSTARTTGATGVEMEALTATSIAALTVYDMCKAVSKDIEISGVRLDHKSGGKSEDYTRE